MRLWVGLLVSVFAICGLMAIEIGRIADPRLCMECDPPSFARVLRVIPDESWIDTGRIRCRDQSIQKEEARGSVWGTTRHRWKAASVDGFISPNPLRNDAPGGYSIPESCKPLFHEAARDMMMQTP